jgi:hypothetical protein
MPANLHPDVGNVMPPLEFSRRELVVTALASGFALAAQPVNAHSALSDIKALMPIVQRVPDLQVMSDLDACVAYAHACSKVNT